MNPSRRGLSARTAAMRLCALAFVAACGAKDPSATQTAARVNKHEITVHQIGAQLPQQAASADEVHQAERLILERLVNRQLAVQKAADLKLDREPKVVQAIETARQEIVARAYADKLGEGASRPAAAEIEKYYDDHPALFAERKIYQLQEFAIEADVARVDALRLALPALKGADEVSIHLDRNGLKFTSVAAVRSAEQLPLPVLPALSRLSPGQALLRPLPRGAQLIVFSGARPAPVARVEASRAIERFLLNEQKRKLLADDFKALRATANIEYLGRFAASAPIGADAARAATAADVAAEAASALETKAVNEGPGARAATVDASTVIKGLGLK